MSDSLARLTQAERLLAEATVETLPEVSDLVDLAEVARTYAERAKLGTKSINHAQKVKLAAERKMADLVDEGQATGQIAKQSSGNRNLESGPRTLSDLGIKKQRLSEARAIRDTFTADEIEKIVNEANEADKEISRTELLQAARQRRQPGAHVGNNTGDNEWYTPTEYVEAARNAMSSIDLDPASSHKANTIVQATHIFTADDDGLTQEWFGNVWMNPPYAQPLIAHFADKAATAYVNGEISQACILVNNATETKWWKRIGAVSEAVCFPTGRVKFWHPDKESTTPLQGQSVIYLGGNPDSFEHHFQQFGLVFRR